MPAELDSKMIDECCGLVAKLGLWPQRCLVQLGASGPQASRWLRRGQDLQQEGSEVRAGTIDELCLLLVAGVDRAEAEVERKWNAEMDTCLHESKARGKPLPWQGWMTKLERRFPDRYKRVDASKAAPVLQMDEMVRSRSSSSTSS